MMDDGGLAANMSLRDWFAGRAMTSLVTSTILNIVKEHQSKPALHTEATAWMAYVYADAMLAERKKRTQGPVDNARQNE